MIDEYVTHCWQVDADVIKALSSVDKQEDFSAVRNAIISIYQPWLKKMAEALQKLVLANEGSYIVSPIAEVQKGTCILFSDALRMDAGMLLFDALLASGLDVNVSHLLAALPTVTPTAKPAISPVSDQFEGKGRVDLVPVLKEKGNLATIQNLRNTLEDNNFQVLGSYDLGNPNGRAWTELGAIDQYGHQHGWKLARHLNDELLVLVERISQLLAHGWKQIQVVTDHGWLLLPGGLPKDEIPLHLTHMRKGRCAVLKEGSITDQNVVPWHWDSFVQIAVAPGISCYEAGKEYEHGGLSPQECITPYLTIKRGSTTMADMIEITEIKWKGLRCDVIVSGEQKNVSIDIRTKAGDPTTSLVVNIKQLDDDNYASLIIADDDRLGDAVFVVALRPDGFVEAQRLTSVGT